MIKKIKIQNFQSHKLTELELDPGVNIIVGSSDSGKSAIIRSLRWLFTNRPLGDAFRSTWAKKDTFIEVEFDNYSICRNKGSADKYVINNDQVFKAFGTSIPDEILDLLKIDSVNIQSQSDTPFLLSDTPGAVAGYFNKIADLEIIDRCQQNIEKKRRKHMQNVTMFEDQVKEYESDLEQYSNLDKIESKIIQLEKLHKRIALVKQDRYDITMLISQVEQANKAIESCNKVIKFEARVIACLDLTNKVKSKILKMDNLASIIHNVAKIKSKISKLQNVLQWEPLANNCSVLINKIKTSKKAQLQLNEMLSHIDNIQSQIEKYKNNLKQKEDYLKENFPDECPLCGSVINH